MNQEYRAALEYLHQHNVLCLATCAESVPWVAPVFYAVVSDKLVFLSAPHTRHCKNIETNPIIAASVQEDYSEWVFIKGVQLQGIASLISESDKDRVISEYSKKHPVTGANAPPQIAGALERISWYAISVQELYFIDNSRGLGHRDQLDPDLLLKDTLL